MVDFEWVKLHCVRVSASGFVCLRHWFMLTDQIGEKAGRVLSSGFN